MKEIILQNYEKHRNFINTYWQTRLPEVDDLSAMFLGLAEEVGEFIEAQQLEDREELISEASDILFYMTGIFVEAGKSGQNLHFSNVVVLDGSTADIANSCFKLLSLYNKSIRKKIVLNPEKFYSICTNIYTGLNSLMPLEDLFIYNIDKLSQRDVTGQNGTHA